MAELDVTYRCDCRCRMCQRWRDHRRGELALREYEQLAEVFRHMGIQLVSIAGGEPLLREDIFSIIRCFAKYGMCVNLCTNGLSIEKHVKSLSCSGASCVTVSLDGATADTHDMIRGAPGSYEKIEKGVRRLIACSPDIRPLVRLRMTVSNRNVDEVKRYYRKWNRTADDVLFQPAHFCAGAFYTGVDKETFGLDPVRLARQIDGTPLRKGRYMDGLIRSLGQDGVYPTLRCYAGTLMVRLDPWGNVYPCLEQRVRVGSVREQDFRTVWHSDFFNHTRKEIAGNGDCRCWYNNTAMIGHYAEILRRLTTLEH